MQGLEVKKCFGYVFLEHFGGWLGTRTGWAWLCDGLGFVGWAVLLLGWWLCYCCDVLSPFLKVLSLVPFSFSYAHISDAAGSLDTHLCTGQGEEAGEGMV